MWGVCRASGLGCTPSCCVMSVSKHPRSSLHPWLPMPLALFCLSSPQLLPLSVLSPLPPLFPPHSHLLRQDRHPHHQPDERGACGYCGGGQRRSSRIRRHRCAAHAARPLRSRSARTAATFAACCCGTLRSCSGHAAPCLVCAADAAPSCGCTCVCGCLAAHALPLRQPAAAICITLCWAAPAQLCAPPPVAGTSYAPEGKVLLAGGGGGEVAFPADLPCLLQVTTAAWPGSRLAAACRSAMLAWRHCLACPVVLALMATACALPRSALELTRLCRSVHASALVGRPPAAQLNPPLPPPTPTHLRRAPPPPLPLPGRRVLRFVQRLPPDLRRRPRGVPAGGGGDGGGAARAGREGEPCCRLLNACLLPNPRLSCRLALGCGSLPHHHLRAGKAACYSWPAMRVPPTPPSGLLPLQLCRPATPLVGPHSSAPSSSPSCHSASSLNSQVSPSQPSSLSAPCCPDTQIGLPGYASMPSALAAMSRQERATYCNEHWQQEYRKVFTLEFSR